VDFLVNLGDLVGTLGEAAFPEYLKSPDFVKLQRVAYLLGREVLINRKYNQGIISRLSGNLMLKGFNRNRAGGIARVSEAERWFQVLLDAAPDAMVVVDQDGKIVFVNTQAERLFGYQRKEILGLNVEVLVPERLREQHCFHRKDFVAQPHVRPMGVGRELFGLRKGGDEFPLEVSLSPVETTKGVLVTTAIRDITERKLVEQNRSRLAAIVESSEDAIISKNLDAVIVSWNAGAQHIFGYTEQEAIGRPIMTLIPSELREEEIKILERLRAGERVDHYETVRVTKAGNKINVSLSISPIKDSTGKIVGFCKIGRDITERKLTEDVLRENEQRLRLAMQAGRMYAYDWDVRTDMVVRTLEHVTLLGLTGPLGSHPKQFVDKIHPDDRPKLFAAIARLTPESPAAEVTYRALASDGSLVWLKSNGRGFFDSEGKLLRVIGVVADVTGVKRAEEALAGMTRKLIEAQEQERARIGRELHDDISQRLAILAVELERLQDDPFDVPSRAQQLQKELAQISSDVQALSHELHSSKLEYLGVPAGMRAWCKEISERQKFEVDFKSDVSSVLPCEVGIGLFRVLQEAIHNAVKHSGVKRIEIQLSQDASEVHLIITDQGVGFDVHEAMQTSGLGLVSMRERVRLLNGTIAIESKPRHGTTVHVRVPLQSEHASELAG